MLSCYARRAPSMNFQPTLLGSTCSSLRKEKRLNASMAIRCDRAAEHNQTRTTSHIGSPHDELNRRHLLAAFAVGLAALSHENPVEAANYSDLKEYYASTEKVIDELKDILGAGPEQVDSQDKFEAFKKSSNSWVSEWRKKSGPSRKSFAEVYGVITALLGYQNQFGLGQKAFSQKIKESQGKRLALAEKALEREKNKDKQFLA